MSPKKPLLRGTGTIDPRRAMVPLSVGVRRCVLCGCTNQASCIYGGDVRDTCWWITGSECSACLGIGSPTPVTHPLWCKTHGAWWPAGALTGIESCPAPVGSQHKPCGRPPMSLDDLRAVGPTQ